MKGERGWNKKKKKMHCCKKGKTCYQVISSFRKLYKIPAKLQPFFAFSKERIKGTEKASPIHTLFHR